MQAVDVSAYPAIAEAVEALRVAHREWSRKAAQADRAFLRWFDGVVTNRCAAVKLSNETNYLAADLYSAESAVYSACAMHGFDQVDVYDLAGIDRDERPSDY